MGRRHGTREVNGQNGRSVERGSVGKRETVRETEPSGRCCPVFLSRCAIPTLSLNGGRVLFYFESLLITRISAPFSSFSLWLSAFKSGSI